MLVEFQGAKALLELPKIGDGWELVPSVKPSEASDINSHLHNIKTRLHHFDSNVLQLIYMQHSY